MRFISKHRSGVVRWKRKLILISTFVFSFCCLKAGEEGGLKYYSNGQKPLDLVFCVDLSGSTNGLINDLRDNLWLIINQAQHMEPKPDLRIGVIGFSRPSFGRENSYVKILAPLTKNFDLIEMELYKLRPSIEKGDQIVSEAIRTAVNGMSWSEREDAVKMIYLVGNGMVTANGYEYVKYCEQARTKNIPIHALYVMKSANWFKELPGYRRIAGLTNGMQTEISINKADEVKVWNSVATNFESMNAKFNATYFWTSNDSSTCRKSIAAADSGAYATSRETYLHRMYFKSSLEFQSIYQSCDYLSSNISQPSETTAVNSGTFIDQVKEMYKVRESIRQQIHKEFPTEELDKLQKAYVDGLMPDNNIFHRSVMNILYRYWGLR
jgi:von Willebrand factor type A domain